MLGKICQRCSKLRKTLDEPPIIAAQPEEAPQFYHVPTRWPIQNGPNLLLVHLYPLCTDGVAQVKQLCHTELALGLFGI
jgi:hypothetical protein